jgi:hypothetical protein
MYIKWQYVVSANTPRPSRKPLQSHEQQVKLLYHLLLPSKKLCHGRTDNRGTILPRCNALPHREQNSEVNAIWQETSRVKPSSGMWLLRNAAGTPQNSKLHPRRLFRRSSYSTAHNNALTDWITLSMSDSSTLFLRVTHIRMQLPP